MKKLWKTLLLLCVLTAALTMTALAADDWTVTYNGSNLTSSFKSADISDKVSGLQPGDTAEIVLTLKNSSTKATDWYMANEVVSSLEDTANSSAKQGYYSYYLSYTSAANKETVLYNNSAVGGQGTGLKEATEALKKTGKDKEGYFYLDELAAGASATVKLRVGLDGETQGNDYQDTLAQLNMQFAVEQSTTASTTGGGNTTGTSSGGGTGTSVTSVKTGDENNLLPYILLAGASGLILLFFAVRSYRKAKKNH